MIAPKRDYKEVNNVRSRPDATAETLGDAAAT